MTADPSSGAGPTEDTRSTLVVDVVDLRRRPGTRRDISAELRLDDLVAGDRSIVDGRLSVGAVVESVMEGVVADGAVAGVSRAPCRRCLDDVDEPFSVEFREVFERHPTEGETWPLEDDRIDLTPVVRELALLSLPLAPLCGEACEGPDAERFPTGPADDPEVEAEPPRDDRWAALDALTFDD
ncbi:MAG: DUF177 domain-containing protein [Actinomycetota bacterium]